jgi:septal ring factor EnvC (AmiA/AmiB activator)
MAGLTPEAAEVVLQSHDDRIGSLHKRIGEIQVTQGDQKTEIKVLSNEVKEARTDIHDAKDELGREIRDGSKSFDQRLEKNAERI